MACWDPLTVMTNMFDTEFFEEDCIEPNSKLYEKTVTFIFVTENI